MSVSPSSTTNPSTAGAADTPAGPLVSDTTLAEALVRTRALYDDLAALWPEVRVHVSIYGVSHDVVHAASTNVTACYVKGTNRWIISAPIGKPYDQSPYLYAELAHDCATCVSLRDRTVSR